MKRDTSDRDGDDDDDDDDDDDNDDDDDVSPLVSQQSVSQSVYPSITSKSFPSSYTVR